MSNKYLSFLQQLNYNQRPPSQSINLYSMPVPGMHDEVRSPTGSTGTPGPLSQQPNSQQSTDNNSETGRFFLQKKNFQS